MNLTMTATQYAATYRIPEPKSSKLLRRAALDGLLKMHTDDDFVTTFSGAKAAFTQVSQAERARLKRLREKQQKLAAARWKEQQKQPFAQLATAAVTRFSGGKSPWGAAK